MKKPWRMFASRPGPAKTPDYPESERYSIHTSWKIADADEKAGNPMCRGNLIAHVYNHDRQGETNARLIAAAPDMLAALRGMVESIENGNEVSAALFCECTDAIAKAEGE